MLPLSVAIISYNEEKNLPRCLKSIQGLAKEVIVLDAGSTDSTVALAQQCGATVYHQPWLGYRDQKNKALHYCTQPWVLSLDCDEELSPELKESIFSFFQQGWADRFSGASFHRCTWFLGRWIRHGDWYPDTTLRLFRRQQGYWVEPIHEKIVLQGEVTLLQGDLRHYSFPSIKSYIDKIYPFAEEFFQKQPTRKWSLLANLSRPLWRFFRAYVLRGGFLDGFPGLWIALATAFSVFVRYSRSYQREQED